MPNYSLNWTASSSAILNALLLLGSCYLTAYQILMGYLMPKFDLYINI